MMFMLAACGNLIAPEGEIFSGETIPPGMGLAVIRLDSGSGARTVLPEVDWYYSLSFTAAEKAPVEKTLEGGATLTAALEPGVWTLEAKGYTDSARTAHKITGKAVLTVTPGNTADCAVYLTPLLSAGGTGNLRYRIGCPKVGRGFLCLYPLDVYAGSAASRESDFGTTASGITEDTLTDIPEGSYLALIDLYDEAGGVAGWSTVVYVYAGMTTTLEHTFKSGNFTPGPPAVDIGGGPNTLAAKLNAALASPDAECTVIVDGSETDLAAFTGMILNPGIPAKTITVRGNGHEVQLTGTGSLFALTPETGTGESLTLVLHDLTLRGVSTNTGSLVQVNSGASLVMQAGSRITGNIRLGTQYGGGVCVYSTGSFTMSGGAISGNVSSSGSGSGVYVTGGGSFTMSGGAVSNNTGGAGAGVFVNSNGTFTMSGGAISGNDPQGTSHAGGVLVKGTFTMSGGAISGNKAYAGGGVEVVSGTFTMRGGAISGNHATGAYSDGTFGLGKGGGVYVVYPQGSFQKTGGVIYGDTNNTHDPGTDENTARTDGHAVCVGPNTLTPTNTTRRRNSDAGPTVNLDTATDENWE
jgi:hypothetical protein